MPASSGTTRALHLECRTVTFQKGRRSFSNPAADPATFGPDGETLLEALAAPAEGGYELTHGFHAYPGRMPPHTARVLFQELTIGKGTVVLDPFMGGGSVLVEAMLLGADVIGSDLNPIALIVALERMRRRTAESAANLLQTVERLAAAVRNRAGMKDAPREPHRHGGKLVRRYAPHLFAELRHWYGLIMKEPDDQDRASLRAIFSSLVVKFSDQRSDSVEEAAEKHYPKGAVTRFFVDKARLLVERQLEWTRRIPPDLSAPALSLADARQLPGVAEGSVDVCLTSPPYPGTYDYHRHHYLRALWLELDAKTFEKEEIGARRDGDRALESFQRDLGAVFDRLARAIRPGGDLLMVIGDWREDGELIDAAKFAAALAVPRGFFPSSSASVERPEGHRFGEGPRKRERLLHFLRDHRAPSIRSEG